MFNMLYNSTRMEHKNALTPSVPKSDGIQNKWSSNIFAPSGNDEAISAVALTRYQNWMFASKKRVRCGLIKYIYIC